MAQCCGMVTQPVAKVYKLKEARTRNIETLRPLLTKGILDSRLDEEDDNDSGISSHGYGNGSFSSPDLSSKTELAAGLASASLKRPAYIKAKTLWDFESSRPGTELSVAKGEIVHLLYRENDKVLVINSRGKRGFIPLSYCTMLHKKISHSNNQFSPTPKLSHRAQKQLYDDSSFHDFLTDMDIMNKNKNAIPSKRHTSTPNSKTLLGTKRNPQTINRERSNTSSSSEEDSDYFRGTSEIPDMITWNRKVPESVRQRQKFTASFFRKGEETKMLVLYDFIARDENDISIYKGEFVVVLNREDQDWWWVATREGYEGFAPRTYLSRRPRVSSEGSTPCSTESSSSSSTSEGSSTQAVRFQDPLCTFHRYEKEEWETDSEVSHDHEQCGHPVVDVDEQETENENNSRWSTWC